MKDWITYKYRVYKINFNVICNNLKIYLFDRIWYFLPGILSEWSSNLGWGSCSRSGIGSASILLNRVIFCQIEIKWQKMDWDIAEISQQKIELGYIWK